MKILGLDIGTNSIGWAVVNEKEILGTGVRIFPAGVENLGEGEREKSLNAQRRESRQKRKQFFRRRLRRKNLLKVLLANRMCPSFEKFTDQNYKDWISLNPYYLRKEALQRELSLYEMGRILLHLSKRRGFLSSSKSAGANKDSAIYQSKDGKTGITDTRSEIKDGTLGQYLASIYPEEDQPFKSINERIRNRYTTRQMYIDEFEAVWNFQVDFNQELYTQSLKSKIGGRKKDGYSEDGILFYQRPLKSQKHLIGNCQFEPNKKRISISHPLFETFRAWQFINTIQCNGQDLSHIDREKLFTYLSSLEKTDFKKIRGELKKSDPSYKFNYLDDDKVVGCPTISKLSNKKAFGMKWWNFSPEEQDTIWHLLYAFDDISWTQDYAQKHWNFDKVQSEYISKIYLKKDYSNLSKKAISNILPFLQNGLPYHLAAPMGGVKNAFGTKWDKIEEDEKKTIEDTCISIVSENSKGGFGQNLVNFLSIEHGLNQNLLQKKLYHHSTDIISEEIKPNLPVSPESDKEIQKLRNPIVITALFELRKVINALIDKYGSFDRINIEMARDLKKNKIQRNQIRRENKRLEANRDRIKKELAEIGQNPTHENILKYNLWEECNKICPYTGDSISVQNLFDGTFEIEHIIPYSRSLDDSFLNKMLCKTNINWAKKNKTPYEYFSEHGDWEERKQQVLSNFFNTKEFPNRFLKFKKFASTKLEDGFISRQLNDTRYVSREAKSYLSKICKNIGVFQGSATAHLRHHWGLNSLLNYNTIQKDREDHRHHAIDAIVVACSNAGILRALSLRNRYYRDKSLPEFPEPMPNFRYQVLQNMYAILVSYKKNKKVLNKRISFTIHGDRVFKNLGVEARGKLHKEYVYGKRKSPKGNLKYHIRKPIESLQNMKHVGKIVDSGVKKTIVRYLESIDIDTSKKDKNFPKGVFLSKDDDGSLNYHVKLPNQRGEDIPIKKVRIAEELTNAEQLKMGINQNVNPRNNHHVMLYYDHAGYLKEEVVSFWTCVERMRNDQPKYQIPPDGKSICCILEVNDMFVISGEEEVNLDNKEQVLQYLYRCQKISSNYYTFRHHLASTLSHNDQELSIRSTKKWLEISPLKVGMNVLGDIVKVI